MDPLAAERLPLLPRCIDRRDLRSPRDTGQNDLLEVDRRPIRSATTSLGIGPPHFAFDLARAEERRSKVRRAVVVG
jgi:hypothetical protein